MMDINNGWFDNINCLSIDHQPQTYVTKHDLELLHKKIIATDLIVQKYQDANKALLRLQTENDDLKEQVEQITNECCIFGKQVTECTQECDNLKEQIGILNGEKRELHQQLRLLQDENTNNYHEIMVLKQYESLKDINDQLTKTVDRQHKNVAKLQLQLQRTTPVVYQPNKNKKEPSETDIALTNSQKSVRELKLTLGRLVNFIQISKIEIPTSLHIRPVLKAHEINDDFLETEGVFVHKPVKKRRKPVIIPVNEDDDDDDEDDDNGDFVDVTPTVQTSSVNTTVLPVDIIEETPVLSKSSSRQQQKKKETAKTKKSSAKTRRQFDQLKSDNSTTKLDDLANELEIALSQPDPPEPISQISAFLSDDDDGGGESKTPKSNQQQLSIPTYTPCILQPLTTYQGTRSTITIIPKLPKENPKKISSFSDDDNEEISQQLPSSTVSSHEQTRSSIQVDITTPMEYETSDKTTKLMSFLSEDDDDNKSLASISTPTINQQSVNQEYASPLELNEPSIDNDTNQSQLALSPTSPIMTTDVLQQSLLSPENPLSNTQVENSPVSLFNENTQSTSTSFVNTLDSNRIEIVLRLLHVLIQVPVSLKPLRLVRRRIQQKKTSEEPITTSMEDKSDDKNKDATLTETLEQPVPKSTEEITNVINHMPDNQIITPMEEQSNAIEENNTTMNEISTDQVFIPIEEQQEPVEDIHTTVIATAEHTTSEQIEEHLEPMEDIHTTITETPEHTTPEQIKRHLGPIKDIHTTVTEATEHTTSEQIEEHLESTEDIQTTVIEIPEHTTSEQVEEKSKCIEQINTTSHDIPDNSFSIPTEEQPKLTVDDNNKINEIVAESICISQNEQVKPIINQHHMKNTGRTTGKMDEKQRNLRHKNPINRQSTVSNDSLTKSISQESMSTIQSIEFKQPLPPPPILEVSKQSSLKPSQIAIISRLLHTLVNLPIKPHILPLSHPLRKRKRKSVVKKSSIILPSQTSNRISRSPTRMQTRSFNSIRACIARCNQPITTNRKRTSTELISTPSNVSKRVKLTKIEQTNNDYHLIHTFLNVYSKEINDELSKTIDKYIHDDILLFNDNIYRIISELMMNKCDSILPLVKQLHPVEQSIKSLLTYINSKSSVFQQHFMKKLNQSFEYEIKQQQISSNRIKILNRLYFLSCSIFVLSSSVTIYARLFDISYYLSHDILLDALSFISKTCSSLISIDCQTNSSNILLHQILFDIFQDKKINISVEYLENLLIAYHRYTHDQEDLIRSFILISRYQTWLWCSKELCSKMFFPLLEKIDDERYQSRQTILILLQYILFQYKDNDEFQRDIIFHDQIKQLLLSLKTLNSYECIVRDKIFFILHTCLLNK